MHAHALLCLHIQHIPFHRIDSIDFHLLFIHYSAVGVKKLQKGRRSQKERGGKGKYFNTKVLYLFYWLPHVPEL